MTVHTTTPHASSVIPSASQHAASAPVPRDPGGELMGLRDGRQVLIRHIVGADRPSLLAFLRQLSPE
jgi:hypothetical protein